MTHAALTPLLGREFDNFLFASIGDDQNGSLLSVVSAFARLDVDPWQEAASLAHMPRQLAIGRLTSLLASLPKGATTGLAPEVIAASLIALLPQAAGFNGPASLRQAAPSRQLRMFIGLGVALPSFRGATVEGDAGAIVLLGAKVPPDRFVETAESVRLESIGEHPH